MKARTTATIGAVMAVPALLLSAIVGLVVVANDEEPDPAAALCGGQGSVISIADGELPHLQGYDETQLANAATITTVAARRGLDQKAAVIGIMTALAESSLRNLANAGEFDYPPGSRVMTQSQWEAAREVAVLSLNYPNDGIAPGDWDSIGLFQSRPSAGWGGDGTPEDRVQNLLNPSYTAGEFFDALVLVPDWQSMEPWQAAQRVQRSAFPFAYADREVAARFIVSALQGVTAAAAHTQRDSCAGASLANITTDGWTHPVPDYTRTTGQFGAVRSGYTHAGLDFAAPIDTAIYAVADGVVTHVSCDRWQGRSPCNIRIDHGANEAGQQVTTLYVHMYPDGVLVRVGDRVAAGDHIADVGSNGNSTGAHLHFEVWLDEQPVNPAIFLPNVGVAL